MRNICFILIICFTAACTPGQPDLEINENAVNNIAEIEKLNDFILADFPHLLESGKKHTECWKYHGDNCYLPCNSSLLQKYLDDKQALEHLNRLTDKKIITGNISIRPDTTIRYQVEFYQVIRGGFDAYEDTVYHHEIVYHISGEDIYEAEGGIIVKTRIIKPDWDYFITKQWID